MEDGADGLCGMHVEFTHYFSTRGGSTPRCSLLDKGEITGISHFNDVDFRRQII